MALFRLCYATNPTTSGKFATDDVRGVMVAVSTGLMAGLRSTSNVPCMSFSLAWTSRRICTALAPQGRRGRSEQNEVALEGPGGGSAHLLDFGLVVLAHMGTKLGSRHSCELKDDLP